MWAAGERSKGGVFSFFIQHSQSTYHSSEVIPISKKYVPFPHHGEAKLWFKGLATGTIRGDDSLTWSGVSGSGHAWEQVDWSGQEEHTFTVMFSLDIKRQRFQIQSSEMLQLQLAFSSCQETTQLASYGPTTMDRIQQDQALAKHLVLCNSPHLLLFPLLPEKISECPT